MQDAAATTTFPVPLEDYPAVAGGLLDILASRLSAEPFNAIATGIFLVAILHTFAAAWFTGLAHRIQHAHDDRQRAMGEPPTPSILGELLHFLGEVEVVFGLWASVLLVALTTSKGWEAAKHYLNDTVNYTEPMFVVVIMALASTRPIITFSEKMLGRVAKLGGSTPAAWWVSILTIGPLLGSFITEPAAMTICALLLARQFYDLSPTSALKYGTLGLLFVNVSIGGTLTHFAAPPVLMVARTWEWDTAFMMGHFGWRAATAILLSTAAYFLFFRRELSGLARTPAVTDVEAPAEDVTPQGFALLPVPAWVTVVHGLFIGWTVVTAHYPALFIGGFLFFLGFAKATAAFQSRVELRSPLLVGFFLGGLVIHGGLQGWWIAPVLTGLAELPLFASAAVLTAFNDNALITYLATLVPSLDESLKIAVVEGAVTGGGLTVIANAPNPAGQALLSRFFAGAVSPARLLLGALIPTLIASVLFRAI
jgi:hypothetical protein